MTKATLTQMESPLMYRFFGDVTEREERGKPFLQLEHKGTIHS